MAFPDLIACFSFGHQLAASAVATAALLAHAAPSLGDLAERVLARCSAPEHRLPQGGAQRRNLLLAAAAGVAGLTAALKLAGGDGSAPQRGSKQANPYALAAAEFAEAEASSAAPPDLRVLPASGKACLAPRCAGLPAIGRLRDVHGLPSWGACAELLPREASAMPPATLYFNDAACLHGRCSRLNALHPDRTS